MAFAIRMRVDVVYVGNGQGGMTVPAEQVLTFFPGGPGGTNSATGLPVPGFGAFVPCPGTDTPTAGNINTAINNAAADIEAQIAVAATLARIQGFATGGG